MDTIRLDCVHDTVSLCGKTYTNTVLWSFKTQKRWTTNTTDWFGFCPTKCRLTAVARIKKLAGQWGAYRSTLATASMSQNIQKYTAKYLFIRHTNGTGAPPTQCMVNLCHRKWFCLWTRHPLLSFDVIFNLNIMSHLTWTFYCCFMVHNECPNNEYT